MGSRDGVEEQDTVFVRSFYKAETKMIPCFRNGIDVSGSRNDTLDPDFCDYGSDKGYSEALKVRNSSD